MMKSLRILPVLTIILVMLALLVGIDAPHQVAFAQTRYQSTPAGLAASTAGAAAPVNLPNPINTTTLGTLPNTNQDLTIVDSNPLGTPALNIISVSLVDQTPATGATFTLELLSQAGTVALPLATPVNLSSAGAFLNPKVTCTGTTAGIYTVNILVQADDPNPGFYKYRVTCNIATPLYGAAGANGATLGATTPQGFPLSKSVKDIDVSPAADLGLLISNTATGAGANLIGTAEWVGATPTNLTLVNGGGVLPYPFNIGPGFNETLTIRCNPLGLATYPSTVSATLKIKHNSPSGVAASAEVNYIIQCNVVGTATYALEYNAAVVAAGGLIDLGNSPAGLTVTKQVKFSNTGRGILTVELSESGAQFNIPSGTGTAPTSTRTISVPASPPNNSVLVDITCQPPTATQFNTTLTVKHDALGVPNTTVTYNLQCTGLPPAGIYSDTLSIPPTGSTINLGAAVVNSAADSAKPADQRANKTATQQIIIENTGPGTLVISPISAGTFTGDHPNDFGINGLLGFNIPSLQGSDDGGNTLTIFCAPTAIGPRKAKLVIIYSDTVNLGLQKVYDLTCTGLDSTFIPGVFSATAGGATLPGTGGSFSVTSGGTVVPYVVQNTGATGAVDVIITKKPTFSQTGFDITGTFPSNVVRGVANTYNVTCTTSSTTSATMTVTYSTDGGSTETTVSYTVTCSTTPIGVPKISVTSNTGGSSQSITLTTTVNTKSSVIFTVTNSGTGTLILLKPSSTTVNAEILSVSPTSGNPIIFDGGGTTTFISPNTLIANQSVTNTTVSCTPTAAGTYTATFRVYSNSNNTTTQTDLSITCTTSSSTTTLTPTPNTTQTASAASTGTTSSATALPPVSSTSVTPCSSTQVLSTPFPQNASGEFLMVNCYVINTAGTVNISLSQALTNPARGVNDSGRTTIQGNAGLMSAWRMGSWFLVPDFTYNAATQTYTFTSAAGTNVYVLFYGGITQPIGSQGSTFSGTTTATAGTTTGNIRDVLVDNRRTLPTAAILSSLVIGFIMVIYVARRVNSNRPTI